MATVEFDNIGRVAEAGDNVAVAICDLPAGVSVRLDGDSFRIDYTVLEGHRFAIRPIAAGQPLLSWGLPFGYATRAIQPGAYLCNEAILAALAARDIDIDLPPAPNFTDRIASYALDETRFRPALALPLVEQARMFQGYDRAGGRGVGTRNVIVLLGVTSRTGSFVRRLAERLQDLPAAHANIDAVAPVAHTEGATPHPHNRELLLRTLAGFMVHPNVGAVLAVDDDGGAIDNQTLEAYMRAHGYPLDAVRHHFFSLAGGFQASLDRAEESVRAWADAVDGDRRSPQPVSQLKIALQCGGSDAFSGISGNPLASWVAREIIRNRGAANLAETDELIGAEPYMLQKVRDLTTARAFLAMVERFKAWAARHGASAEGNPSGGNKLRGLYNVTLKSIGAARKRHPDVRLDYVIDYGAPMHDPGFYFMDSPGNDLESIAGQVASGCNLIAFVTGNGSITNFPFVPTLKIVTTSARYQRLAADMDVNAGAYLDGAPMDELGTETFELALAIASGRLSAGERAGHAQVQIWRDWRAGEEDGDGRGNRQRIKGKEQTGQREQAGREEQIGRKGQIEREEADTSDVTSRSRLADELRATPFPLSEPSARVGLIVPTSLCSGQIAQIAARRLTQAGVGREQGIERFVALVHTEGCGASDLAADLSRATLLSYLRHPDAARALLLEHGCEKTHNDDFRNHMLALGMDPDAYGWASIQGDGGIQGALEKMEAWFTYALASLPASAAQNHDLWSRRVGLCSMGEPPEPVSRALAILATAIAGGGGAVIMPEGDGLKEVRLLTKAGLLRADMDGEARLAYGEFSEQSGFQIMDAPTEHWVERLTGLAATGIEAVLVYAGGEPVQGHPLVPVLQMTTADAASVEWVEDFDLILAKPSAAWPSEIAKLLHATLAGEYTPVNAREGNVDFQITRGRLGISL